MKPENTNGTSPKPKKLTCPECGKEVSWICADCGKCWDCCSALNDPEESDEARKE